LESQSDIWLGKAAQVWRRSLALLQQFLAAKRSMFRAWSESRDRLISEEEQSALWLQSLQLASLAERLPGLRSSSRSNPRTASPTTACRSVSPIAGSLPDVVLSVPQYASLLLGAGPADGPTAGLSFFDNGSSSDDDRIEPDGGCNELDSLYSAHRFAVRSLSRDLQPSDGRTKPVLAFQKHSVSDAEWYERQRICASEDVAFERLELSYRLSTAYPRTPRVGLNGIAE
jgi:hypothetical protein